MLEVHSREEAAKQLVKLAGLFKHHEMAGVWDPHNFTVGEVRLQSAAPLSSIDAESGKLERTAGPHIAKDASTAVRSEASTSIIFFTFSLISGVAVAVMPLMMFSLVR